MWVDLQAREPEQSCDTGMGELLCFISLFLFLNRTSVAASLPLVWDAPASKVMGHDRQPMQYLENLHNVVLSASFASVAFCTNHAFLDVARILVELLICKKRRTSMKYEETPRAMDAP